MVLAQEIPVWHLMQRNYFLFMIRILCLPPMIIQLSLGCLHTKHSLSLSLLYAADLLVLLLCWSTKLKYLHLFLGFFHYRRKFVVSLSILPVDWGFNNNSSLVKSNSWFSCCLLFSKSIVCVRFVVLHVTDLFVIL